MLFGFCNHITFLLLPSDCSTQGVDLLRINQEIFIAFVFCFLC